MAATAGFQVCAIFVSSQGVFPLIFKDRLYGCGGTMIHSCSTFALILLFSAAPALASNAKTAKTAEEASLASKCVAYGPGFIASESLQTCIKVGGRVRVEYRWTSQKH
jgi:hypothetical protein